MYVKYLNYTLLCVILLLFIIFYYIFIYFTLLLKKLLIIPQKTEPSKPVLEKKHYTDRNCVANINIY